MVNLHYNFIMHEFSQQGDFESVFAAFTSMKESGIQPDMYSYRSLIDACAHTGEVDRAVSIFEVKLVTPHTRWLSALSLTAFISQLTSEDWTYSVSTVRVDLRWTQAGPFWLSQELLSSGSIPNVFVYNSLMNVRAEDTTAVWQLYIDMQVSYSKE
jgi:pentatricopeptide repeat protein